MNPRNIRARHWPLLFSLVVAAFVCVSVLVEMRTQPVGAVAADKRVPQVGFPVELYAVNENQGPALIPVRISAAPAAGKEVVVRYLTIPGTAISGASGDYIETSGVITFTHSSPRTQAFPVVINDDAVFNEPVETINLILWLLTPETATIRTNVAVLAITDDDVATPTPTGDLDKSAYLQPIIAPGQGTQTPPTQTPPPLPTDPSVTSAPVVP